MDTKGETNVLGETEFADTVEATVKNKPRDRRTKKKRKSSKGVSLLKHVEICGIGVYVNTYAQVRGCHTHTHHQRTFVRCA